MAFTRQVHRGTASATSHLVLIVESCTLTKLRELLEPLRPLHVTVSTAMSWGDAGPELSYRGQRMRRDRSVARVEIGCSEGQAERIASILRSALQAGVLDGRGSAAVPSLMVGAPHAVLVEAFA